MLRLLLILTASAGEPFPSIDLSPEQQWDTLPEIAKWQIILVIGFLEAYGENPTADNPHYMRGGQPGKYPTFDLIRETLHPMPFNLYDPFGFHKNMSDEKKAKGLVKEINNGRLAQIGIFGFISADKVPGSVPLLENIAIPYDGDVMGPFILTESPTFAIAEAATSTILAESWNFYGG